MKKLLNFGRAIIYINIEGFFVEKMINLCKKEKIELNEMQKKDECNICLKILAKDFKKVVKICKKTKCKVKIIEKEGLPYIIRRYRKRKILFFLIIIVCIGMVLVNSLIWKINIISEDEVISKKIEDELYNLGIHTFVEKNIIDEKILENELLIRIKEIVWMEIKIDGVVLNIEFAQGEKPPEVVNEKEMCHIVAKKEGLIVKVVNEKGKTVTQKDAMVEKGDILISGIIDSERRDSWLVHAEGKIYAKTWYRDEEVIYFNEVKENSTGQSKKYYGIKLKNQKVFLGKLSTNYKEYDTILNEYKNTVFNITIPITICECNFVEKETEHILRTYEEAIEEANSIIEIRSKDKIPENAEIVQKYVNVVNADDFVKVETFYECIEQIGIKQKISN